MQRFALLDEDGIVLATVVYHTTLPMVPEHVPHEIIGLHENAPIGFPLGTPPVFEGLLPAPKTPQVEAPELKVEDDELQVEAENPKVPRKKRWWRGK